MNKIKTNKKALSFKLAFFAIIAVGMIIIALGTWVNEWNDDYSSGLTYDLGDYNKLDEVSEEAQSQQTRITVKSTGTGEEFESTSIRGVFGILNNIYEPFRIVFGNNGMIDSITERFGMPDYIRHGLVSMMVISITFALVAILFRLNRRNV